MLNKNDILSANDLKTEVVDVPEWGGQVTVSGMSAFDRDAFEASLVGKNGVAVNLENLRSRLVARCLVDESGARIFTDADIDALSKKSGAALGRIFDVAQRLNGMEAGAVDAAAKK